MCCDNARDGGERKGRASSRNNVTQLKIQCADVVVYQMEIHIRISLSKHHKGIYALRERVCKVMTMIGDNPSDDEELTNRVRQTARARTLREHKRAREKRAADRK